MKRMRTIIIPLSIIVVLFGCNQQKQEDTGKKNKKTIVTTAKSEQKTYHPWQEYNGTAYAYKEANLGTALPGRVEEIHYEVGDYVNKGTLLVELSAELYAQALAEKNSLKKDFNRVKRLKEKGSVSQQKYDHTKAKYEAAKAKARMMKKNCEIRAPFSGTIVDFLVQEGENFMFSPGLKPNYTHTSGIVQLMQLNKIKVEIDVNESSLKDVSIGQQAKLTFEAYPEEEYQGTVSNIKPILNTETHSATTEITVNNKDKKIKPGMYANVELKLPETEDIFIPLNSIYRQSGTGNDYVFIVNDNNTVTRKPIEKKYTMEENVAVKGVQKNKEIVVNGKKKLNEGDKVVVDNS